DLRRSHDETAAQQPAPYPRSAIVSQVRSLRQEQSMSSPDGQVSGMPGSERTRGSGGWLRGAASRTLIRQRPKHAWCLGGSTSFGVTAPPHLWTILWMALTWPVIRRLSTCGSLESGHGSPGSVDHKYGPDLALCAVDARIPVHVVRDSASGPERRFWASSTATAHWRVVRS